jgi:hypothetical protein
VRCGAEEQLLIKVGIGQGNSDEVGVRIVNIGKKNSS